MASVDAGLNMLRTYEDSTSSDAVTLASLIIIRDFINEESAPSVDKSILLDYAIKLFLSDTIIQLLTEFRNHYDLNAPNLNDSRQSLQQQIELDSETSSRELIGFSYIYTYYIRSELNISQ